MSAQTIVDKIAADIERVGWSAIGVLSTEDEPIDPFCYSIGFTEIGHPEMIVFSMGHQQMHAVLGDAYMAIKDGHRFQDGERTTELCAPPFTFAIRAVPGPGHPANWALARYGEIELLQAVWPDATDELPWENWSHPRHQVVLADQPDHEALTVV